MSNHAPFIINLDIHPQGYTFRSTETLNNKNKKTAKASSKPPQPKVVNRLIKEIAISSEIPPIIPEQNTFSKDVPHQEEPPKQQIEVQEEEEDIDCQVKRQTDLLQSPAHWFDSKLIHPSQKDHFSEFFTGKGSKSPQLYEAYRNFMVEAYKMNPKRYLTFVSCRRVLRGDVSCLLKIYKFLVSEGIINYGLSPDGNYNFKGMSLDKMSEIGKKPQSCLKKVPQKSQTDQTEAVDTDNLTVSGINKNFSRNYRVYCSKCQLICGIVWYVSQVQEQSIHICCECYSLMDKQQSLQYTRTDISKKMQGRDSRKSYWCLQDNIKLLDFMGNSNGKQWQQIYNQFQGKKSIQDILLQFMQFPITNFNPYTNAKDIEHQPTTYPHREYIDLLSSLYSQSPYSKESDHSPYEESKEVSPEMSNFRKLNTCFLNKFYNKIDQLKTIQTIWELTNLDFKEQPLINRTNPSKVESMPSHSNSQSNSDHL